MTEIVSGRLVLDDRVEPGRVTIDDGVITVVDLGAAGAHAHAPYVAPGFVDVHVHGWGGHDAMGDAAALDGMARALLSRGVTSFLPTAVTAALDDLTAFADRVRAWMPSAPADGAQPLGFNLEGPFLAAAKRGAHAEAHLRAPGSTSRDVLDSLVVGLRLLTVAPELDGATDLIGWLHGRGVAVSVGHSAATVDEVWKAYAAGARSTTHLFNAMSGVDHRSPGVAVAALLDDDAYVELIADGIHVHPAIWPLITRLKPPDRLLLVSDALAIAGTADGRGTIGGLEIEVRDGRATLAGTDTLAGSVIALDSAVRNAAAAGIPLPAAVAAASRNPLQLLGVADRGRVATGQRADLVELDEDLAVLRVMRGGTWISE
jgi:N-acetylglucosamine-6-phosphate deacetylase